MGYKEGEIDNKVLITIVSYKNMKILVAKNIKIKDDLFSKNELENKYQGDEIYYKNMEDTLKDSVEIARNVVNKYFDKVIILSDYGIGEFLAASKVKGVVVAQISDEYTVKLTVLHNNTKIIIIPLKIVSIDYAKIFIDIFLQEKFEGDRHLKRIKMLDKLGG